MQTLYRGKTEDLKSLLPDTLENSLTELCQTLFTVTVTTASQDIENFWQDFEKISKRLVMVIGLSGVQFGQ